mgnify:CR=1 FL=1
MHASIKTVAFRSIDTIPVEVQAHVANGLPAMGIVGLTDKTVAKSRERVCAALASSGLALPPQRIAIHRCMAETSLCRVCCRQQWRRLARTRT